VPLLEKSGRLKRYHRWERIAIEASKQCGRGVVPKIAPLQDYSEMLQIAPPYSLRLILWEREEVKLREVIERSKENTKIFFIIGQKGDLTRRRLKRQKGLNSYLLLWGGGY